MSREAPTYHCPTRLDDISETPSVSPRPATSSGSPTPIDISLPSPQPSRSTAPSSAPSSTPTGWAVYHATTRDQITQLLSTLAPEAPKAAEMTESPVKPPPEQSAPPPDTRAPSLLRSLKKKASKVFLRKKKPSAPDADLSGPLDTDGEAVMHCPGTCSCRSHIAKLLEDVGELRKEIGVL